MTPLQYSYLENSIEEPGGLQSMIQGIKPGSPALQVDSLPSEPPGKPRHVSKFILDFQR